MKLKLANYWKVGGIILIFLNLNLSCNNVQKSKKEGKELIEVELAMKTRNNPFGTVMVPFGIKEKIPPSLKLENRDSTFLYFLQTISNEALDSISKNQKYDRDNRNPRDKRT